MDKSREKKTKTSQPNKVSSSGREIRRPKHLLTTSSDETSHFKKPKISTNVRSQIDRLKGVLLDIENQKVAAQDEEDVSENTEGQDLANALAISRSRAPLKIIGISNKTSEKTPSVNISSHVSREKTTTHKSAASSPQLLQTLPADISCLADNSREHLEKPLLEESIEKPPDVSQLSSKPVVQAMKTLNVNEKIRWKNNSALRPDPLSVDTTDICQYGSKVSGRTIPTLQCPMHRANELKNVDDDTNHVPDENVMQDEEAGDENEEIFDTEASNCSKQVLAIVQKILEQNKKIIAQNNKILARLPDSNAGDRLEQNLYEPLNGFPLSTVDQFNNLDSIHNKDMRRQVYNYLLHLGGAKIREFLNAAFKVLMTDKLIARFTWLKSEKTLEFGNTRVANVLFRAASDCPLFRGPNTKAEFKDEMLEVMRAAKQRYRKSIKKAQNAGIIRQEIRRLEEIVANSNADENSEDNREDEEDEEFADDEL